MRYTTCAGRQPSGAGLSRGGSQIEGRSRLIASLAKTPTLLPPF